MNRLFFTLMVVLLAISGCSSIETVSKVDFKASDYFPKVGIERTYVQYGTTGENMFAQDVVKAETGSDGKEAIYIHETGGLAVERVIEYEITDKEVRQIYAINAFRNEEVDILEIASQKKWKTGDADQSVSYLTGAGLEVEVPAGVFENCIEITTETKESSLVKYYAPEVGLIKTIMEIDGKAPHVMSELYASNLEKFQPSAVENEPPSYAEQDLAIYENREYGFSFNYPKEWEGKIEISHGSIVADAEITIDFSYVDEALKEPLFSIVVYDGEIQREEWENPMMPYIAAKNGKTYALATSGEPSLELLQPENSEKLQYIQNMFANLDIITSTFK